MDTTINTHRKATNKELLLPYLAPFVAYAALASVPQTILTHELNYAVRLLVVPALLVWGWKRYVPLVGPGKIAVSAVVGVAGGIFGTLLWVLLLRPFVPEGGVPWTGMAFGLRLVSAGFVIPLAEELLMRGYIFRVALQYDLARKSGVRDPFEKAYCEDSIDRVPPGAWSVLAVAISTVFFASGHLVKEWPAAIAYGLLMAMLWIVRKDLLSCVVAHGTTNICLALYVITTGHWSLW